MSYKDRIKGLTLDQLRCFSSVINKTIDQKKSEEKRIVWRVCDKWVCHGNFREDDYLSAVKCLAEQAEKLHSENKIDSMGISIERENVPISEYESWFE